MSRRSPVAAFLPRLLSCALSFSLAAALSAALGLLTAAPVGAQASLQPSLQTRSQSLLPSDAPGTMSAARARVGAQKVGAVEAELVADVSTAAPGQPFRIGLRLLHDPHWHTYWRNPGDSGLPTQFVPSGPGGVAYADILWPAPKRLAVGDLANYGYEGDVLLSRQVTLPASFDESSARFEVLAQWLVCKDVCIPGEAALALEVPVGSPARAAPTDVVARFDDNAARAPDMALRMQAGWWQQGREAYLVLPDGMQTDRAEFFPYFEGVVTPAAAQSLVEVTPANARSGSGMGPQRAMRLLLKDSQTNDSRNLPVPAAGVVQVAGGRPVEVDLQRLAEPPVAGRVLSVAEVAPAAPAAAPGLLDRLRGAVGGSLGTTGTALSTPASSAPVSSASVSSTASNSSGIAADFGSAGTTASGTLGLAIAGALLGGLILNLMPCVFPVIGLKVLSFTQSARGDGRRARLHALTFSAGVVLSFLLLGAALLALRSAGAAAGWGFQMQSPLFVGAMALLFVLIGLNLFGVFETGVSLTRLDVPGAAGMAGGSASVGTGLLNSFWTGVIAVLVATPCTAPFMGSAVGFTMSSPPLQTMLVFAALGVGMAAPYLVLGWVPRLMRGLPRPGPWLLVFKQFLGFPMLATAAWLAWVLTLQTGAEGMLRLLMSAILLGFAAWIYGRAQSAHLAGASRRPGSPGLVALAAAVLAVAGTGWQLSQIGGLSAGGVVAPAMAGAADRNAVPAGRAENADPAVQSAAADWQPWSADSVAQALAQGRPVMVDFTAAWCISCQANKKLVLERQAVRRAFEANDVLLLRADWTRRDPAITAELARFGRNGVPLYLVYTSANEPPRLLPELLTVDIVLTALDANR